MLRLPHPAAPSCPQLASLHPAGLPLPLYALCPTIAPAPQDPVLALERRCLGLLQQQGQQPDYQLLRLLREQGVRSLPPFLLDEGDSEEAAFRRFVTNRPHLFEVVNGDELRPAQGEQRVAGESEGGR